MIQLGESTTKDFIDNINANFDEVNNKLEDGFDEVNNKFEEVNNEFEDKTKNYIIYEYKNNSVDKWSCRAWANGAVECWGMFDIKFTNKLWEEWGGSGLYYNESSHIIEYPEILDENLIAQKMFKNSPKVFVSSVSSPMKGMFLCTNYTGVDTTSTTPKIGMLYYTKLNADRIVRTNIHAIGQWK